MTFTTSAGTAQRRTACASMIVWIFASGTPAVSLVRIGQGPTALQVIPNGATSRAAIRVKVSSALFDPLDRLALEPQLPGDLLMLTMRSAGDRRIIRFSRA